MICKKCGSENHETAKFCRNCGNQLQQKDTTNVPLNQNKQNYKKKTGKKWGVLLVLTVVIAGVIAGFWITKNKNEKKIKEYKNQIAQGNKYVEDLDYEKAEESYLKAIKIDPKRKKPYLKLADIYVAQEKYDKAVKILEDASKNVTVTEKKGEDKQDISEVKQEIETKKEEISNASEYTWVVKPEIEADDIYYLRGGDSREESVNERKKQMTSQYAICETTEGTYALIDMDGNWYKNLECERIATVYGFYFMRTLDKKSYYLDNNNMLGELTDFDQVSNEGFSGLKDQGLYYYQEGLRNIISDDETYEEYYQKLKNLNAIIPVKKINGRYEKINDNDEYIGEEKWEEEDKSKYALWKDDELITKFTYDECGSENDGLIAVKRNGKWGYVNEKGKIIIPLKYDASWDKYYVDNSDLTGAQKEYCYALWKDESLISDFTYDECGSENSGLLAVKKGGKWGYLDKTGKVIIPIKYDASWKEYFADLGQSIQKEYCYAASEGYVTLVKNNKWEMRTTDNKLVILPGIFEKILPVYDGKCWVKKDGKWGVIQLNEAVMDKEDENKNTVDNTESNTLIFTNAQIAYIRQQLSVPKSNNITMTISDSPYYWEVGGCSLVNVTFTENGEVVASADVNVDTAECTTSIFNYTKTE